MKTTHTKFFMKKLYKKKERRKGGRKGGKKGEGRMNTHTSLY